MIKKSLITTFATFLVIQSAVAYPASSLVQETVSTTVKTTSKPSSYPPNLYPTSILWDKILSLLLLLFLIFCFYILSFSINVESCVVIFNYSL